MQGYIGLISGFRTDMDISSHYRGVSGAGQFGPNVSLPPFVSVGAGIGGFISWTDPRLRGSYVYAGGSIFTLDISEGVGFDIEPLLFYFPSDDTKPYARSNGTVDKGSLLSDIYSGDGSALNINIKIGNVSVKFTHEYVQTARLLSAMLALKYAYVYEDLLNENNYAQISFNH